MTANKLKERSSYLSCTFVLIFYSCLDDLCLISMCVFSLQLPPCIRLSLYRKRFFLIRVHQVSKLRTRRRARGRCVSFRFRLARWATPFPCYHLTNGKHTHIRKSFFFLYIFFVFYKYFSLANPLFFFLFTALSFHLSFLWFFISFPILP